MNRFTAIISSAVLALSALAVSPASARMIGPEMTVSYADIDLDSEAGARTMLQRINHAARSVCGDDRDRMSVSERAAIRQCMRETTMQTVARLDHPMVTAMYEGREPTITLAQR